MSVLNKLSSKHNADLLSSIRMSFESAQADMLMEQREVEQLNNELQKTIQVKDAVELVSNSMDPNDANYGVAMEAIFVAAGLTLPSELLVPSFEAEDKKADADEKKKGFVKRAWEAIKAFFVKLWNGLTGLFDRKKQMIEKAVEAAEDLGKDEAGVGGKDSDVKEGTVVPKAVKGKATLAGKTSAEFASHAPALLEEYAVGMTVILHAVGQGLSEDGKVANLSRSETTPENLFNAFGLGKAGFVLKGPHDEHSVKFGHSGNRITVDIKTPTDYPEVEYVALDAAGRKKLSASMRSALKSVRVIDKGFKDIKEPIDEIIAEGEKAIANGELISGYTSEHVRLILSAFSALTQCYTREPVTRIATALLQIRRASL